MKCPNCRADVHNSTLRCPYCGYNIQQYREAISQNYTSSVYNKNDARYDTSSGNIYTEQVGRCAEVDARNYYSQESIHKNNGKRIVPRDDYNWILFVLGVVGIGLQIINTVLMVALIIQL